MFSNILSQKVYVQEVIDPATGKHYNLYIQSYTPDIGFLAGCVCNDLYLTNNDPQCDILVGIGKKAFTDGEFTTLEEMTKALEEIIKELLPDGFLRFESIIAHGIKGNEI